MGLRPPPAFSLVRAVLADSQRKVREHAYVSPARLEIKGWPGDILICWCAVLFLAGHASVGIPCCSLKQKTKILHLGHHILLMSYACPRLCWGARALLVEGGFDLWHLLSEGKLVVGLLNSLCP